MGDRGKAIPSDGSLFLSNEQPMVLPVDGMLAHNHFEADMRDIRLYLPKGPRLGFPLGSCP